MTYRDWLESLRKKWIGRKVIYEGETHIVIDVDYNGYLLIDRPAQFTETTAISITSIK